VTSRDDATLARRAADLPAAGVAPEPREISTLECPRCGHPVALDAGGGDPLHGGGDDECPACGVIVAKALAAAASPLLRRRPDAPLRGEPIPRLVAGDRRAVALGLVLGLGVWLLPLTRYAFSYAITVFHELGHTALGWAFGYPTIPSFDFAYGGGVSIHFGRSLPIALLAAGVVGWLAFRLRETRAFWPAVAAAALYAIAAMTPLHEALILAAGHGAEISLAGLCLYRALAPLRWPAAERSAYAACGAFVLAADARFGWQLLASAAFRRSYEQAKGGGHWMDLSRIADELLGVDLGVVAVLFCLLVLATPAAAHLAAMNRPLLVASLGLRSAGIGESPSPRGGRTPSTGR
jgi:hypothetical protein